MLGLPKFTDASPGPIGKIGILKPHVVSLHTRFASLTDAWMSHEIKFDQSIVLYIFNTAEPNTKTAHDSELKLKFYKSLQCAKVTLIKQVQRESKETHLNTPQETNKTNLFYFLCKIQWNHLVSMGFRASLEIIEQRFDSSSLAFKNSNGHQTQFLKVGIL
ncbi:hypothetical protein L1049_026930 [Liquidambar formosana]|uniref:Uncharacterized protein n=1 Tax=Liquidambar formosana TaxID=63359 RepID=A0AAP0NGE2_LIQFO